MRNPEKYRMGFTLLEILIAIGILAIGLVTVFSLFPIGIYAVKDTVENTRGAALAGTARSELAAMRADLRVLDSATQWYNLGYIPFGPWRYPGDLRVFRAPLYEYFDAGVLHRRVMFDRRTMVPITLTSAVGGINGTAIVTIQQADLDRDSDRLEYYYNTGTNSYADTSGNPYDIYARILGREYRIVDRAYDGNNYLRTLTLAPPFPTAPDPNRQYQFEVLLPVAMKEPPIDVPQEWAGGIADFGAGGATIVTSEETLTRNLAEYLCEPSGGNPGGWISAGDDWFQLTAVTRNAQGMPASMTFAAPVPETADGVEFKIPLPLVIFDSANEDNNGTPLDLSDDVLNLPVMTTPNAAGGGGQQLSWLDAGATIEIMFDGAEAAFTPENGSAVSCTAGTLNSDTSAFIVPGNFIRVDGRDYEIATALAGTTFTILGTAPDLGTRQFKILLGDGAGKVSRFPVKSAHRNPTPIGAKYAFPIGWFGVGRDANGNLPTEIFPGTVTMPFTNPVHVLPNNGSQFSCEVTLAPKSPIGNFTTADSNVTAPSWAADYDTPEMPAIPYPPSLDPNVAGVNGITSVYQMRLLTEPTAMGAYQTFDIAGVLPDADGNYTILSLGGAPNFTAERPFHADDRNDFDSDIPVGTGTFVAATSTVDMSPSLGGTSSPQAIYLAVDSSGAPGVWVTLTGPFGMRQYQVFSVPIPPSLTLDTFVIFDSLGLGYPADGDPVTISIAQTGTAGQNNYPRGRGLFTNGSDTIKAVYADRSGSFVGVPGSGFPFAAAGATRYNLAVGDYIHAPDGLYYALKAIQDNEDPDPTTSYDSIVLDRAYLGVTSVAGGDYFEYTTPIERVYKAQVAVFRNYEIQALKDQGGAREAAAAFGFDRNGVRDADGLAHHVHLDVALPENVKPGDYIRADGDADHPSGAPVDIGLADGLDGDWRWYMIDSINSDRSEITLTNPYEGYVPGSQVQAWQPASVSGSLLRTYETFIGAF